MTKKDIFNFNHIDPNIDTEKLKQTQDLYAYYHKYCLDLSTFSQAKKACKYCRKNPTAGIVTLEGKNGKIGIP